MIEFHDDGSVSGDFVPHLPGLLNWALEMSDAEMFELIKNTAVSVPSLAAAKIDVLTASNSLAAWLQDCCIVAPDVRSQIGTAIKPQVTRDLGGGDRFTKAEYQNEDLWLYASYRAYCNRTGHSKPVNMRKFSDSLVDLCRNQLKIDVEKTRSRGGAVIIGIAIRSYSDKDSPNPISGGGTAPQIEDAQTPDEVLASVPFHERVAVEAIVGCAWDITKFADNDVADLTRSWMANHSRSVRFHSVRYLQSHPEEGSAIIGCIAKFAPEFANVA